MEFVFVSGRPCLDLLGTLKWRHRDEPEEQLLAPGHLTEWAVAAGLVDCPVPVTARGLHDAISLRESTYLLVRQRLAGATLDRNCVDILNRSAKRRGLVPELAADGSIRRRGTTSELLATIAADALDLLGGRDITKVRECSDPECTRLFVDQSRGRPRRWCGMAECGNRAKVDAFRRRQRA